MIRGIMIGMQGERDISPKGPYRPALLFTRTEAERKDQKLSWLRSDRAFFAAGACHILAFEFMERHRGESYSVICLSPTNSGVGHHVYVTDGVWAFDFNGWTLEATLIQESVKAMRKLEPDWACRRMVIDLGLESFCKQHQHRLPSQFAHDPTERARLFIERFG